MDLESLRNDPELRQMLYEDEGCKSKPYPDTRGFWTGGRGHNLTAHGYSRKQISIWERTGIPRQLIIDWFVEDLDASIHICSQAFDRYEQYPDNAQRVLADLVFDVKYEIWDWHELRGACQDGHWQDAATEIKRSLFDRQLPNRANRLADKMKAVA